MKIKLDIRWFDADAEQELAPNLLPLLFSIKQTGSLRTAAVEVGLSYRTAWGMINEANAAFNQTLVLMQRGRGAELTEFGQTLLEMKQSIDSKYRMELMSDSDQINQAIASFTQSKQLKTVRFHASDDLAILSLKKIAGASSISFDFQSKGSLEALTQLTAMRCDVAGFHFPEGDLAHGLEADYRPLLNDQKYRYIHLARRQQGLMFNPALSSRIKDLKDITRRSIKFINRQKGSGTRVIFDQLLKNNDVDKKDINGYEREEFTHTAVAALISSGHADIGFGLEAAAVEFNLSFLPLVKEVYVIAMNQSLSDPIQKEIRALIKSPELKRTIKSLPGYGNKDTGKVIHAHKFF